VARKRVDEDADGEGPKNQGLAAGDPFLQWMLIPDEGRHPQGPAA
jgi:hypothetical protein